MSEKSELMCEICRCDLENPVNFCKDSSHSASCKACIVYYIEKKITDSFLGSCPIMYCPAACHVERKDVRGKKNRNLLPYFVWKDHVHPEVLTKYNALSNSVLAFLCGGCHTLKSLDVGYESNRSHDCYSRLQKVLVDLYGEGERGRGVEKFQELEVRIQDFCYGDYTVEEFYHYLLDEMFISLKALSDEPAWEIFQKLLKIIPDPERRGNLHLRYLRDRPRMKTLCCNRDHCFRCKVKDYHEGKTCAESTANLDQSIVTCPQCNIALARGDGCNTITCVCGKQFSWSQEKETSERCQQFLQMHPEETCTHCAIVLCTRTPSPLVSQAKAWQSRHRMEVNRSLTHWFQKKYWPVPSQACTVLPLEQQPDGVKEAIELWRNTHVKEVTRCREENDRALRSLFLNFVPNPEERAVMAYRLITPSSSHRGNQSLFGPGLDTRMIQSAMKWTETHHYEYQQGLQAYEQRSAQQFLFLYGERRVQDLSPAYLTYPSGGEWCRDLSNTELTYTNQNRTVERVGSVSCYPAAFCKLTAEKCLFRVVVETAPKSSNWLTFGIARTGMANASSDGVGRTTNTWGISDDRSSSSSSALVAASGTEVARFRKLRVGDVLLASIDVVEGWAEIAVNEEEFVHRFVIPCGRREDYCFAMSFANDHRVTILSDAAMTMNRSSAPSKAGELNLDHTIMYNHLRKQLKAMLAEPEEEGMLPSSVSSSVFNGGNQVLTSGEKWLASCGMNSDIALEMFEVMRESIDRLLALPSSHSHSQQKMEEESSQKKKQKLHPFESLTWNSLVEACSWYYHNREAILNQKRCDLAMSFSMTYAEDASFIAAMTLIDYHQSGAAAASGRSRGAASTSHGSGSGEKEAMASALAYMGVFAEEMQLWYDYNASLREPVIENIARHCRCLPRHLKTCPLTSSQTQRK